MEKMEMFATLFAALSVSISATTTILRMTMAMPMMISSLDTHRHQAGFVTMLAASYAHKTLAINVRNTDRRDRTNTKFTKLSVNLYLPPRWKKYEVHLGIRLC